MGFWGTVGGIAGTAVGSAFGMPGVGGALGGGLGGLLDGGKGTNPSTKSTAFSGKQIPKYMQDDYDKLYADQKDLYNTPFQEYTGESVAPFSQDQLNAFQGVRDMQGQYTPLMSSASNLALQAGQGYQGGISQGELDQFMNPYQQGVIDITKQRALSDYDSQLANLKAKATGAAGGYGGSRQAILESQLAQNVNRNLGDIQMTGSAENYNQALRSVFQNRAGMLDSSRGIAGMAEAGQGYGYRDLGALAAQGQEQQNLDQTQNQWDISEFQRKLQYPQQQADNYTKFLQSMMGNSATQTGVSDPGKAPGWATGAGLGSMLGSGVAGSGGGLSGGISSLFGRASGTGNSTYSNNMGWIDWKADGGLIRGPRGYAEGGKVSRLGEFISTYAKPGGLMSQTGKSSLYDTPWVDSKTDLARPFKTIWDYLTEEGKPPLSTAWDKSEYVAPQGITGMATPIPGGKTFAPDMLGKVPQMSPIPEGGIAGLSTQSLQEGPVAQAREDTPETQGGIDFNEPLFRFGAALMGTPGRGAHVFAKAATAYADAKDVEYDRQLKQAEVVRDAAQDEVTNQLNKEKTAADIRLADAQIAKMDREDKATIQAGKDSARFDVEKLKTLRAMAQSALENSDGETAAKLQAKIDVEMEPEMKTFVLQKVLSGSATSEEVNSMPLLQSYLTSMFAAGLLTQLDLADILKKYKKK